MNIFYSINRRHRVALAALFLCAAMSIVFYARKSPSLETYAKQAEKVCAQEAYRPACYDREIPTFMKTLSMEDTFEVARLVQRDDTSYTYCHVLGHELAAREVDKDPSKWKEVVARVPSGICSNGGIHGAFQERFRAESLPDAKIEELKPVLQDICKPHDSWNPTLLEQATCSHAIGHLAMYVTSADIDKSIALCNATAPNEGGHDFRQICFDGVFMQIFQPLEPEDFALIKGKAPTKETVESFCRKFSGAAYESCTTESWPLHPEIKTPEGLASFCALVSGDEAVTRCYRGAIYVLTALDFNFDSLKVAAFCSGVTDTWRGKCFAYASSRFIETDWGNIQKSVALCTEAQQRNVGESCWNELVLFSTYNFHAGSKEFYALCNALPEEWKNRCLLQQRGV